MYELLRLPYSLDALEPVISARTLEFHYGKHLQAYVDNLNKLIAGTELEAKSLDDIIVISSGVPVISSPSSVISSVVEKSPAIFNNAGQVLNHEMYFTQFRTPDQAGGDGASSLPAPTGNLASQIEKQWGSLEAFQTEFELAGASIFGSGWVWLQADENGELSIGKYTGADNPVAHVMPGQTGHLRPILTFDVWEHAYYLDYQNRRAAYLHELWKIVDWNVVEQRYR